MTKKSEVKNKKEEKNKKNTKDKFKKFIPQTSTELALVIAFVSLLILVIILSFKAVSVKKEYDKRQAVDFIMPVLNNEINNTFSVDITDMKKDDIKEYKFMITNYKEGKIAAEEIKYQLELTNKSNNIKIKLYKDKSDNNLLTSDEDVHKIKNNKLTKEEKDTDTYYLIIRATDEVTKKDNISIKIAGIN